MPIITLSVTDDALANWVIENAPKVNPMTLLNLMAHTFSVKYTTLIQNLIKAGYAKTLTCLVERKIVDLNENYYFEIAEQKYFKLTPPMMAAKQDNMEMVKLMIEQGADISVCDLSRTANILTCSFMNPAMFGWLLQLAQARNQLEKMLLCGESPQSATAPNLYKRNADENNITSYTLLLDYSVALFERYPAIANKVLNNIISRYILEPANFEHDVKPLLDHRCFKPAYQYKVQFQGRKTPLFKTNEDKLKPPSSVNPHSAEAKIVYLMMAFRKLLANKERYQPYLALLESDLQKAVDEEQQGLLFDELCQKQNYTHKYIDDILFPIPHANYQKTKKSSLLMRVLLKRLRHYQFANHVERWSGYIPSARANATLANQVIFTESQYGTGLFHGKFSHAIQLCLLGEFMQQHPELTAYTNEAGESTHLTLSQAVALMVTVNTPGSDNKWWNRTIDFRLRPYASLGDPFQLHSVLMFDEAYPFLSAYSRDSFCGGFIDLMNAFNRSSFHQFTTETFADFMAKTEIGSFFFTHYLCDAAAHDYGVIRDENNTRPSKHELLFFKPMTRENPTKIGYLITEKHYDDLAIQLTPLPRQPK